MVVKRIIILFFLLFSCKEEERPESVEGLSADRTVKRFEVVETDRGRIRWRLLSDRADIYGDTTVICNVHLEFYNDYQEISSILTSDSAYLFSAGDMMAKGNVLVRSMESGRILKTEALFWRQEMGKIVTKDSVTIRHEDGEIRGRDFESNPDLTEIRIRGVKAVGDER